MELGFKVEFYEFKDLEFGGEVGFNEYIICVDYVDFVFRWFLGYYFVKVVYLDLM